MGDDFKPEMTAGHSLGEFSALVAAGALSFEDGLKLIYARAMAMQKACEAQPSTMAAIIAMPDEKAVSYTHLYEKDKTAAIESGCNEFLTKPVSADLLKMTINKYLKQK